MPPISLLYGILYPKSIRCLINKHRAATYILVKTHGRHQANTVRPLLSSSLGRTFRPKRSAPSVDQQDIPITWCIYIYIYIYMCVCVRVCVCMYVYVCMHVCMYARRYVYVCICICVCEYVYVCMCVCMHVGVYVCVNVCMQVCVRMYVCMYVNVCVCMQDIPAGWRA